MKTLPNFETLLLKGINGRLYVTLNRPAQRNAMNNQMNQELHDLVDYLTDNDSIRVVILRGAEGTFCAGGDIKERKLQTESATTGSDPARDRNIRSGQLLYKFWNLSQTFIAVVEGAAMGGGFGFACLADLTIIHKDARLGMPETTLGIAPAQIAPYVVNRIGLTRAKQMALTGARINGEAAFQLGIAQYLAEDDKSLNAIVESVLDQVERCAPKACAATKKIMQQVGNIDGEQMIEDAADIFSSLNKNDEGKEGHTAFVEKRKPVWLKEQE